MRLRHREIDVIMLGMEVYGMHRKEIAGLVGCSEGTVLRMAHTTRGQPGTLYALTLIADKLAAEGRLVRAAGEEMLKLIPPEIVPDVELRSGYVRVNRGLVIATVNLGTTLANNP